MPKQEWLPAMDFKLLLKLRDYWVIIYFVISEEV